MSNPGRKVWRNAMNKNFQIRMDCRYLAIVAEEYRRRGIEIKTVSELGRIIIEEKAHQFLSEGAYKVESADEAIMILEFRGMPVGNMPQNYSAMSEREGEIKETNIPKREYVMTKDEIAAYEMNLKFLQGSQNTPPIPRNYDYEEGELDNIIGAPERIKTEEEMKELEKFFDEMNEMKRRNLATGRKKKEEVEENNAITERLTKQQQSLMRRGLLQ